MTQKTMVDLVDMMGNGNTVLFVGAGFNYGIKNIKGSQMPFAKQLSEKIINLFPNEKASLLNEANLPLQDLTGFAIDSGFSSKMISLLSDQFTFDSRQQNLPQHIIGDIEWKNIYTTNYDNSLESIIRYRGKGVVPVTLSQKLPDYARQNKVIHINGFIDKLTSSNFNSELRLTSDSYNLNTSNFVNSDWIKQFQMDVESAQCVIFVGVSMNSDIDIQRIIQQTESIKQKLFFINATIEDGQQDLDKIRNAKQYSMGNVLNIGVEEFCNIISENLETILSKQTSQNFSSFSQIESGDTHQFVEDSSKSTRKLLEFGFLDESLLLSSINSTDYTVRRSEEEKILAEIDEGNYRVFMINSMMGNGKSILVTRLKFILSSKYRVFEFKKMFSSTNEEIERIMKSDTDIKTIIIIDNYIKHLPLLNTFKLYLDESLNNVVFILTARNIYNENFLQTLFERLGVTSDNVSYIPLDRFNNQDRIKVADQLIHANYLDILNNAKVQDKRKYMQRKNYDNYYNILISLVKREDFISETEEIFDNIRQNQTAHKILISSCIISLLGTDISSEDMLAMNGLYSIPLDIKNDSSLKTFMNLNDYDFEIRSSIFAQFLIHHCANPSDVMDIMYDMAVSADKCFDSSTTKTIRQDLISVSNTTFIFRGLSEDKYKENLVEFYNKLKKLNFFDGNPHFWVQYAMSCMDIKEYERALGNLEVANERDLKNMEKYQGHEANYEIIIQKQRCYLEKAIFTKICDNPFDVMYSTLSNFLELLGNIRINKQKLFKHSDKINQFYILYQNKIDVEDQRELHTVIGKFEEAISKHLSNNPLLTTQSRQQAERSLESIQNTKDLIFRYVATHD